MTVLVIAGLAVTAAGLGSILLGAVLSIGEAPDRSTPHGRDIPETSEGSARFADELAKGPLGPRLVFLGIVLIVVGGFLSGVSSLIGAR